MMTRALLALLLTLGACGGCPGEERQPQIDGLLGQTIGAGPLVGPPFGTGDEGGGSGGMNLIDPWPMHVIVSGIGPPFLDGADGANASDVNGDGLPDVISVYEDSQKASLSLHPGYATVQAVPTWPSAALPNGQSQQGPEDAILADIDGDGFQDILVGAEGQQRTGVLFSPTSLASLLVPTAWTKVDFTASITPNNQRCMRVAFADVDNDGVKDVVCGGKEGSNVSAQIRYYTNLGNRRDGTAWVRHDVAPVGWVMQLYTYDVDGDGDLDIVYSDKEPIHTPADDFTRSGLRWLENGGGTPPSWTGHQISAVEVAHRWFSLVDWDGDGDIDIAGCRGQEGLAEAYLMLNGGDWLSWSLVSVPQPSNFGIPQMATAIDVDQDGVPDFQMSAFSPVPGGGAIHDTVSEVAWLHNTGTAASPAWERGEISGVDLGTKYDNLVWLDVDNDGDQDAITSEQFEDTDNDADLGPGLGLVWYANPLR